MKTLEKFNKLTRSNGYLLFCLLWLSFCCSVTAVKWDMPSMRYFAGVAAGVQLGIILWRRPADD